MIVEIDRAPVECAGNFGGHDDLFRMFLDADRPEFRAVFLLGFLHPLANGLFTCECFTFIKNGCIFRKACKRGICVVGVLRLDIGIDEFWQFDGHSVLLLLCWLRPDLLFPLISLTHHLPEFCAASAGSTDTSIRSCPRMT